MWDISPMLGVVRHELQGTDWKDTILKVLLGGLISSTAWWFSWGQSLATETYVEAKIRDVRENPPILRAVPALVEKLNGVDKMTDRVTLIQQEHILLRATIDELGRNVSDLKDVMKGLTQEIRHRK